MSTATHDTTLARTPARGAPRQTFLPFRTPVRGHRFAARPPRASRVETGRPVRLRREPDHPIDPLAVAVWAVDGGTPWRIGYLERAVAARVAPMLDAGLGVRAVLDGRWQAPGGWYRPVVRLSPAVGDDVVLSPRPPRSQRRITG